MSARQMCISVSGCPQLLDPGGPLRGEAGSLPGCACMPKGPHWRTDFDLCGSHQKRVTGTKFIPSPSLQDSMSASVSAMSMSDTHAYAKVSARTANKCSPASSQAAFGTSGWCGATLTVCTTSSCCAPLCRRRWCSMTISTASP